jgi:two-component system, NtrC family, sensor histidine kinase KinB
MTGEPERLAAEQPRLEVLYQVSRDISSRLDLAELLPRLLQQTLTSVQGFSGSIMVLDAHGKISQAVLLVNGRFIENALELLAPALEQGLAGWVVANRQSVLLTNTAADPRWYRNHQDRMSGSKSVISVPLFGRERVVGVLTVGRLQPDAFQPDDHALADAIAAQAGIAIENAQLFAAERREREVSNTLREVARIINATLDLKQVLALMLEQLQRILPSDTCSILLRHGDSLRVSAARGFEDLEAVMRVTFSARAGISARVLREKRILVLDDVRRSDEWLPSVVHEADAIRSWLGVPLVAQNQVMGLISIDSRTPGAFSGEDVHLAAGFAEQAAVAVLNARLYAQSEQRSYGLRALATTAQAINGTLKLDEVLRLVVRHAQEWLSMEGASLALVDGESLVFKEAVGPTADYLRGASIQLGAGIAGWVAQNNEPIIVPDVSADPRFFGGMDEQTGFVTRALACVPVRIQDRAIGVIEVVNPASGSFDPDTLSLLDSLASLAGTAIVQAQRVAELQAAENRFAGLFEDSIDPILITNLEGVITDVNRRAVEFFGYPRNQVCGMRITQLHRVHTDNLTAGRYLPLLNGQPISYQTRITTQDGREIVVEVNAKLIERGGQKFIQWVQQDLSERLAIEELRNDLMSMIIHDLRSPLGNIISALGIMRDTLPASDELPQSLLSIAERAAGRLSRLVDSLLEVQRLEAGDVSLHRVPADLPPLLQEAVEQVEPSLAARQLSLQMGVPEHLRQVSIDTDLIRRVLVNLLDNAAKYTPNGGVVTVGASNGPGCVTLSVRDTGPGIPEGDQERIFEKFARVQRESTPKGLGLGLAFCKLAVEAHGGRIWAENDNGAVFYFTLPTPSH